MKIAVVGLGHVGLVTAASLARWGHDVTGTDVDGERLNHLKEGETPFFEPGLDELIAEGVRSTRLRFVESVQEAIQHVSAVFICVGTPPRDGGGASLVAIEDTARAIAAAVDHDLVVIEKSTVPAGTASRMRAILDRAAAKIEIVSNPEFLREGTAVEDSLSPSRVVIGAETQNTYQVMRAIYRPLIENGVPVIETGITTAEVSKHAANAFLATKVSFINAVARICERVGADVRDVADLVGADPRIGREMLDAGLGFGGSCFHKDLLAFHHLAAGVSYDFPLLLDVIRINQEAIDSVRRMIEQTLWNPEGKRVALFGVAFKPGTDDIRYAPALVLAETLVHSGADVVAFDPLVDVASVSNVVPALRTSRDPYEAARAAHCIAICTEWPDILLLDFGRLRSVVAEPIIVDARNCLPEVVEAAAVENGFSVLGVGRPEGRSAMAVML
jgi:UDPglucose 6-dehydrogenase